jgi:hypothetical protein
MSANLGQLAMGARGLSGLAGAASGNGGALSTLASTAGEVGSGLGVASGLEAGTPAGYAGAAISGGKLANQLGAFGSNASTAGAALGTAGGALGVYNGLEQGGISGYGEAGVGALQAGSGVASLAGDSALSGTLGTAAGALAVPLDVYNEVNNWKSGATTSDAMGGAETGAAVGSFFGPIGTGVGALIGGAAGALSSLAGPTQDPETKDVQNVINATSSNGNNPAVAASAQNPYLELAGLMDDKSSTLPEYQQYGRMGEQAFTTALTQQINQAAAANPELAADPTAMYNQVVAPWVSSMNTNGSTVGAAYTATNNGLIQDMTQQYMQGDAAQDWQSVGGSDVFSNIYNGSPYSAAAPPASTTPATQSGSQGLRATGTEQRARGGHIMRKVKKADGGRAKRKSVLDSIRSNFKDAPKTRYDDGGYVDYASNSGGAAPFDPTAWETQGNGNQISSQYTAPQTSPNMDVSPELQNVGTGAITDAANWDQMQGNQDLNNAPATSSGLGSLAKEVAPYAALLPIGAALASKLSGSGSSSSGSTALPAGQSTSVGPFQAQTSPRTANAVDPNTDWYTYGEHPEAQFYSNNSIGPLMGDFVSQPSASSSTPSGAGATSTGVGSGGASGPTTIPMPAPTAGGQSNTQPVTGPRPQLRATGGALDTLPTGVDPTGESRHVQGPGDGTSDDIDAKLSDGEYVMDANTVSMLGNGSNKAGAARLDQLRDNLRRHAAKPMAKGKQFMKAKDPMAYMRGGRSK